MKMRQWRRLEEDMHIPTPVRRSSEVSTLIDRSGLTLPMI